VGRRAEWSCPECGRRFANRNQSHACGGWTLDALFAPYPPLSRALFEALLKRARSCGPVRLHPAKTRVGIINRMTFAAASPRRYGLRAHVVLRRRVDSPRFVRVDRVGGCFVHVFELRTEGDLDGWLTDLIHEAARGGSRDPSDARSSARR